MNFPTSTAACSARTRTVAVMRYQLECCKCSVSSNDHVFCVGTFAVKAGLAQMLKGGIIMDVVSAEQAKIAEEAGVCAGIVCEYSGYIVRMIHCVCLLTA